MHFRWMNIKLNRVLQRPSSALLGMIHAPMSLSPSLCSKKRSTQLSIWAQCIARGIEALAQLRQSAVKATAISRPVRINRNAQSLNLSIGQLAQVGCFQHRERRLLGIKAVPGIAGRVHLHLRTTSNFCTTYLKKSPVSLALYKQDVLAHRTSPHPIG